MLIIHKGHTDTIQVYSVTVMTHVKALQAGHSSQGTSEPITPALWQLLRYGLGFKQLLLLLTVLRESYVEGTAFSGGLPPYVLNRSVGPIIV